jgi:hypothetical protein
MAHKTIDNTTQDFLIFLSKAIPEISIPSNWLHAFALACAGMVI